MQIAVPNATIDGAESVLNRSRVSKTGEYGVIISRLSLVGRKRNGGFGEENAGKQLKPHAL